MLVGCLDSTTPPAEPAPPRELTPQLPPFGLIGSDGVVVDDDSLYGRWVVLHLVTGDCGEPCSQAAMTIDSAAVALAELAEVQVAWLTLTTDLAVASALNSDSSPRELLGGTRHQMTQIVNNGLGGGLDSFDARPMLFDRMGDFVGRADDADALVALLGERLALPAPKRIAFPAEIDEPGQLNGRRLQQLQAQGSIGVETDFKFEDQALEAGITFLNRTTDDSGRAYKPVHYDHGNGVAVADVDADGRLDLYFTNQVGANELWRNLGGGEFSRIGAGSAVELAEKISVAASFADVDNDGDPDLYVTTVYAGNHLFLNDGAGRFLDATASSGLDHVAHSSGATFFDYNNDGLLDMFLSNVGVYTSDELGPGPYRIGFTDAFAGHLKPELRDEPNLLFRNQGDGRFEDVTQEVGINDRSWSGDASAIDLNEDGWQDLYVLNMQGHDQYWQNDGGKRFINKTKELFPSTPWGSMSIKAFDYDVDGDIDILLSDMHSDMSENVGVDREKLKSRMQWPESLLRSEGRSIYGNALFQNEGGRFIDVSDENGTENYWPWGHSVGDLNADGYEDIFIASSMNFGFRYAINSVLLNDRGRGFRDAEFILGVEPRRNGRTARPWFLLDCGGSEMSNPYCEEMGLIDPAIFWGSLGSRSSAIADFDDDGDLDIVTAEFHDRSLYLVSDLSSRKAVNSLKVRLRGTKSNRDGLGARVELRAGGKRWVQVHDGKSGYMSQSLMPLYFGLGDLTGADELIVRWPSGVEQRVDLSDLHDDMIEVVEPAS
jgi:hypothetical protein